MKRLLIVWWLSDKYYMNVIYEIHKWNQVVIIDNLKSWCLKNLRLMMNEIWYPPKFYEVDYFNKSEMGQIYERYNFDEEINFIT
jgi:hypothetical protein